MIHLGSKACWECRDEEKQAWMIFLSPIFLWGGRHNGINWQLARIVPFSSSEHARAAKGPCSFPSSGTSPHRGWALGVLYMIHYHLHNWAVPFGQSASRASRQTTEPHAVCHLWARKATATLWWHNLADVIQGLAETKRPNWHLINDTDRHFFFHHLLFSPLWFHGHHTHSQCSL